MPSEAVLRRDCSVCSTVAARAGGLNTKPFAAKYIYVYLSTYSPTILLHSPAVCSHFAEHCAMYVKLEFFLFANNKNCKHLYNTFPFLRFHVEIHVMLLRKGCCRHSLRAHRARTTYIHIHIHHWSVSRLSISMKDTLSHDSPFNLEKRVRVLIKSLPPFSFHHLHKIPSK